MRALQVIRLQFRMHQRLFLASAIGALIGLGLPGDWATLSRGIVGWDVAVLLYLVLAAVMMATHGHAQMRRRAAHEDEGRWVIVFLTSSAALASLIAIGTFVSGARDLPPEVRYGHLALGAATIVLSWLFIHTLYAIHYAYDHYRSTLVSGGGTDDGPRGGLVFPGTPDPDYWDFCYFAFVVGMTAQTSDVAVSGRLLRRLTVVHGIVSFCFNTVLLALAINIAAGLL
jgi:uncharacterized membrane protein